ncbi:SpaH/EbpB family LPXTG-anchored major pilin [Leucobacter komagatae]|uniref:SpaH/EbpB family LPXTG-anchored major pilin n=1 Tax=Leucobacter komagatae TaxID=55969 RepID=UPI001477522F|nr:SpaH/EbpB family LPXTG-anchored major pilin [Leucobacter komagatae]
MTSPRKRGLLAGLSAVAAAALLVIGGGSAAQAAPIVDLDPDATATLNIHKFEQGDVLGVEANGLEQTVDMEPMGGITFTAKQVPGIDLSTNAGWEAAANLTLAQAQADTAAVAGTSATTDGTGLAQLSGLPLGLYLVTETGYPAGVTPSDPFLITLPLTHPTNTSEWLYDVHVYPKNSTTGITKTVEDADSVKLGDTVTWTINGDIPKVAELSGYRIVDPLDSKLEYVSPARVSLTGGGTLETGDYSIDYFAATNSVSVTLTDTGLAKLAAAWQADATAQVQVEIDTKVIASGEIANHAVLYPNEHSFTWDPNDPGYQPPCAEGETENCTPPGEPGGPVPSDPVETRFGGFTILKQDAKDTTKTLEGATFRVFTSRAAAEAFAADPSAGGFVTITTGTGASAVEQSEFVSDADGLAAIDGLRYSNFADGEEVAEGDAGYQSYWLLETVAPAGFELLAEPIEFTVTDQATEITLPVKNVPHNAGFELPLTGGAGTTVLTVLGLLLLAGGVTAAMLSRRKTGQQS